MHLLTSFPLLIQIYEIDMGRKFQEKNLPSPPLPNAFFRGNKEVKPQPVSSSPQTAPQLGIEKEKWEGG